MAQNKNPGARPVSTRNLPRDASATAQTGDDASYESFLLGPDLGPSSMMGAEQHQAPQAHQAPHQGHQQHQQHGGIQPQATTMAAEDLMPKLEDLPPEFATRTLIASAKMGAAVAASAAAAQQQQQQQQGGHALSAQPADKVQISAKEVQAQLGDPRLIMLHEPDSKRAATFRILRHRLVERGHPRTILVSSAERGEGKTMLAINLALALSECGRARVLLVEANLRRPTIAKVLGFRPPKCFSEQLQIHKDKPMEPWLVAQVASPWLHVIAVDTTSFQRPRVIDGPAFENGIDQLKRVQYDYLVLDTPQVLGNADVNLVQDSADAVLLSAWARETSSSSLRRAIDQLTPGKIVGVAMLEV